MQSRRRDGSLRTSSACTLEAREEEAPVPPDVVVGDETPEYRHKAGGNRGVISRQCYTETYEGPWPAGSSGGSRGVFSSHPST